MTASLPPLPASLRRAAARALLHRAVAGRKPRMVVAALVRSVLPGPWHPDPRLREQILDAAVRDGDPTAAAVRLDEPQGQPGSAAARRRAVAIEVLARDLDPRDAAREAAVARFLRETPPKRVAAGRTPADAAADATAAAARLRASGHPDPRIVITFPRLEGNPFTDLMERAYERHGLAPVHVIRLDDVAAVVAARTTGEFSAVLHVNASNWIVWPAKDEAAAAAAVDDALRRIDGWIASGVQLVVSVHDGPILGRIHATAERALAQGIADRAAAIHLLARTTPEVLDGWLTFDPARTVYIAHPNYDGVYPPPPSRDEARTAIGAAGGDPLAPDDILVGLIGLISPRKGARRLLDALAAVPDPLPDGRRVRLLLAGRVIEPGGEALIRAAYADPRVIPELGFVPDDRMSVLLAALDVAVVPYERYLNSGWTVLALTGGIPIIAAQRSTAQEVVRPGALLTFDPGRSESLSDALGNAPELVTGDARAEARRSVAGFSADAASERFATLVRGL